MNNDCDPIGLSHRVFAREIQSSVSEPIDQVLFSFKTKVKEVITPKDVIQMMELDFCDRHVGQSPSQHDRRFLSLLKEGIHQREDKHYEMPLPFIMDNVPLPNNRVIAIERLQHLKRKLKRDADYQRDYVAFMKDLTEKGFAERVPVSELHLEDGHVWYIPHHGVYHPKKPGKIRVVFDCSSSFKGFCLNDHLMSGPNLTNLLVGVLCRFRQEEIAFICDVEAMFHQFKVNVEHRNFLRFLLWENLDF